MAEAQQATEQAPELFISAWALPELIEAASRTGQAEVAAVALGRLAEAISIGQTDRGSGSTRAAKRRSATARTRRTGIAKQLTG